jgi:release factor glutamine methyltransferase
MTTLAEAMQQARSALAAAGIEDPAAETRIIIGGLLGFERIDFITRGSEPIDADDEIRVQNAMARRLRGEPPYRILGRRSFYGLEFKLSQGTLEPRPDTEILVDLVLEELKGREQEALQILDLGTGTGAICQALLSQLPNARGIGVDLSGDALATASENAGINGLADRFSVLQSDWFQKISGRYDAIVSNPPYISSSVIHALDREVRDFDPHLALDGGTDGLEAYRRIAAAAGTFLNADGVVAVETGFDQRQAVGEIFSNCGFFLVKARKDYGGNDRAQVFRQQ